MQLSWSQALFLRLNHHIGKSRTFDRLVRLVAHDGLYVIGLVFFLWLVIVSDVSSGAAYGTILLLGTAFVLAYAASYTIALLWPHVRPIRELPHVKELFETLGTWKSFPSDHTIAVTVIAATAIVTGAPTLLSVFFVVTGLGVALGRIYAGVHYPRDILGGLGIGILATGLAFQVLYGG